MDGFCGVGELESDFHIGCERLDKGRQSFKLSARLSQRDTVFSTWRILGLPPFGPRRLLTVAPMMLGCGDSMMCLLPLPYIARANTVPVAKKNATIDDRLALLVIGYCKPESCLQL